MAAQRFSTQLLINGTTVTGEGRAESILNPSTGEVLCGVREASAEELSHGHVHGPGGHHH